MTKRVAGAHVALLFVVAACCPRGSKTPGGPAGAKLAGPTEVQVEPLAIKAEAKKQDQALILGTREGSTVIPLVGRENTQGVDVMWVRPPNNGRAAEGGSSPSLLISAPSSDGKVRVGVFEEFDGSAGHQMRAAVWMSSFVAATTLGKDLTDYRFSAEYEGFIDGPSAGGLMTAGFIASMTGDTIDPLAAMTGTINPDGTIGPVGGIPHKIAGSAKKGKKRLGYPIGQQFDFDMNKQQKVDLEEVAKEHGVTVTEIADVYEAYEFLTGKKLPRPEPLDVAEMKLGDEVDQRLAAQYDWWRALYDKQMGTLVELATATTVANRLPDEAIEILRVYGKAAEEEGAQAAKLKADGLGAAAYYRMVRATVNAAAATSTYEILQHVRDGDVKKAKDRLAFELSVMQDTETALRAVGEMTPQTITDHLLQISAYQPAIAAWGNDQWGQLWVQEANTFLDTLAGRPAKDLTGADVAAGLIGRVMPGVKAITRGQAYAYVAQQTLDIEAAEGLAYRCSLGNAKRLAMSFGSAAVANLAYFEAVEIEPYANSQHMSMDKVAQLFMRYEPRYLVAKAAFQLPMLMQQAFDWEEDSLAAVLGGLSGSILSYFNSAIIINEYYSITVGRDANGQTVVGQEKAFGHMLKQAEQKAREHAHEAKVAIGQVPVQARLHYQIAQVLREGKVGDQLLALEEYWKASTYSQVAVMLARN